MRLKTFTAATMAEAMQQVRDELGPDAAIVGTEKDRGGGVRIIAALEPADSAPQPVAPAFERPAARETVASEARINGSPALRETLAYHGVPDTVVARLARGEDGPSLHATLTERLEGAFHFASLGDSDEGRPLLLAGPPGVGKTLAIAKLATRAVLSGQQVRLITTDTGSAGAVEQLTAFARPLKLGVETAEGPAGLAAACAKRHLAAITLIDTQGINPYDGVELAGLAAQITAARAEPILVLGAGGDARESGEMAEVFARIGCTHLIVTRLDLARRFGGILAAAMTGLALTGTGASPLVAHGLQPLTPAALARLLVAEGRRGPGARLPEHAS